MEGGSGRGMRRDGAGWGGDEAVRCGAVRCGAMRCGAVRCGTVRHGAVLCGNHAGVMEGE